jgi:chromosomal replication initiation ATPase DnaA
MTKHKSKKFIDLLDSYNKEYQYKSVDYSILISMINTNYYDSYLNNSSIVGKTVTVHDVVKKSDFQKNLSGYYSIWDSSYSIWQYQHETDVVYNNIINKYTDPDFLYNKPSNEVAITSHVTIDMSFCNIYDILKILEAYEYKPNTEYNIDLKSLHNIKPELLELNNMVGMESLKQNVFDQLLYFIQKLHIGKDSGDFKHTAIYGPPGTGKTEIAKIIGKIYSKLGILKNTIFKKVTRNDLIAGYLGQTAIKTKKVIDECLGGVLFIDEAYSLASNDREDSYSKECLDTLCEALSDHKNDLMVIIAGYEEELINTFFRVNRGLDSRFIWRFTMDQYSPDELMKIFKKKVNDQDWSFVNELDIKDKWFHDKKDSFKSFGRDMELLLTYVKVSHSKRIYGKDKDLKKKISLEDMNNGYDIFLKNKKIKKETIVFGLYT